MKRIILLSFLALCANYATRAQDFSQATFQQFADMRIGTGQPVYWYCVGEIYSYPEGKLMARVEGLDTARRWRDGETPTRATQLSRKTFVYRDATTNEVLRQVNGQKVEHIEYPYQFITYELKDGVIVSSVEQGKGAGVQKIAGGSPMKLRQMGNLTIVSAPLFLNFTTPRGKYEAYENYDFLLQPKGSKAAQYQLTWNRFGDLPPFFGPGKSIFQLVSYRVDKYKDLPPTMRGYLEKEGRLWMKPPVDLDEIRQLQK
jgi:hypothetical protein